MVQFPFVTKHSVGHPEILVQTIPFIVPLFLSYWYASHSLTITSHPERTRGGTISRWVLSLTGLLWRYIGATASSAGKAVYHRNISHVNILTMIQSWFLTWRRNSKTFINFTEPTIYSFTNGSFVGKMTVDIQIFLELQVEFPTIMWLLFFFKYNRFT